MKRAKTKRPTKAEREAKLREEAIAAIRGGLESAVAPLRSEMQILRRDVNYLTTLTSSLRPSQPGLEKHQEHIRNLQELLKASRDHVAHAQIALRERGCEISFQRNGLGNLVPSGWRHNGASDLIEKIDAALKAGP